jgi:hypothetical protein
MVFWCLSTLRVFLSVFVRASLDSSLALDNPSGRGSNARRICRELRLGRGPPDKACHVSEKAELCLCGRRVFGRLALRAGLDSVDELAVKVLKASTVVGHDPRYRRGK